MPVLTSRLVLLTSVSVCVLGSSALADDAPLNLPEDPNASQSELSAVDTSTAIAAESTESASELAAPANPQSAAPAVPPTPFDGFRDGGQSWFDWSRASGDWGGFRTDLENGGLTIASSLTFDWSSVLSGGARRTAYSRRFLSINGTVDFEKLAGLKGLTAFIDFQHYGGEVGNPVGDAQGTNAYITPRHLDQIAELWVQAKFFDDKLRVKLGKIDANVDFAWIPVAAGFVNYNGSWSPNFIGQPTYPDPAVGGQIFFEPCSNFYAGFGIFDGATQDGLRTGPRGPATFFSDSKSDSWYFIGEAGIKWAELGALKGGRLAAGGWGHTGNFAAFDGSTKDGSEGFYALVEQQLTTREGSEDPTRGLFAFARYTYADKNIALINNHVSAGLVLKGTFKDREADEAGLMWSFADLSSKSTASGDEHNVEAYYKLQLFKHTALSPSIQYINNPSGNKDIQDAWLGTLSVNIVF